MNNAPGPELVGTTMSGVPVPRYFFDTYNGDLFVPDEAGIELGNLEAAKAMASRGLAVAGD